MESSLFKETKTKKNKKTKKTKKKTKTKTKQITYLIMNYPRKPY